MTRMTPSGHRWDPGFWLWLVFLILLQIISKWGWNVQDNFWVKMTRRLVLAKYVCLSLTLSLLYCPFLLFLVFSLSHSSSFIPSAPLSFPLPLPQLGSLSIWLTWAYSKHDSLRVLEPLTWHLEQKQKLSGLLKIRPREGDVTSITHNWSNQPVSRANSDLREERTIPNLLIEG